MVLPQSMRDLVCTIRDSHLFGIVAETGCGCPVASALYALPGASKTLFASFQPYNKEYAQTQFGSEGLRVVSMEHVRNMVTHYSTESKINLVYAASFQVGDSASSVRTHGWIGIWERDRSCTFYHVSVHEPGYSREELIQVIGEVGIELLAFSLHPDAPITTPCLTLANVHIDMVRGLSSLVPRSALTFLYSKDPDMVSTDSYLCFNPSGELIRLDEWCRDADTIVLYKGSFNPITVEHVRLMQTTLADARAQDPTAVGACFISINTVDKGAVQMDNLMQRVSFINAMGFHCLVNCRGRFTAAIHFFRTSFPTSKLIFPVGMDTYDRIENNLKTSDAKFRFVVFPRTPCSSSEVRALLELRNKNGTLSEAEQARLTELVPSSVLAKL